jgi:Zn-dependent protease
MTFAIVFVGWIFSLCLHEFSHALVAYWGGDYTVKEKGYLSFNPLRYTDPFLSLILPLIFLLMGGIGLPGGAVYIETWRLRSPRWRSAVSLAGPVSNLALAMLLAVVMQFAPPDSVYNNNGTSPWPGLAFLLFVEISAIVLNLIPLPPFDGYGVIEPFLSEPIRDQVNRVRAWLPLVVFAALWYVPFINEIFWTVVSLIAMIFGVPFYLVQEGFARFQFWRL